MHNRTMSIPECTSLWWPQDRIQATVNIDYIKTHLKTTEDHSRLYALPPWGEGLTSETYLDYILAKAGRFFLILTDIGIPTHIFALVDKSYDDADLPISHPNVDLLQLAGPDGEEDAALDDAFFHAQWRFLVRGIPAGEHVEFDARNEGIPVEVQRNGAMGFVGSGSGRVERVILAGAPCRSLVRSMVQVKDDSAHFFLEREEVVDEVRSLRRLAHEHVFSVYASYFADDNIYILFSRPHERHLMSFLTDPPQSFKKLPKPHRRHILVNWPHCLADGLAWLHAHDQRHGAIRPSNVLVDSQFNVLLGQFEALDTLLPPSKINDIEAYQYSAPERWVLSATVQGPNLPRSLPSGGRTVQRPSTAGGSGGSGSRPTNSLKFNLTKPFSRSSHVSNSFNSNNDNNKRGSVLTTGTSSSRGSSLASQATAIRVGYPGSDSSSSSSTHSRLSFAPSTSSSGSDNSNSGNGRHTSSSSRRRHRALTSINQRPSLYAPPPPSVTTTPHPIPISPTSPTATSNQFPSSTSPPPPPHPPRPHTSRLPPSSSPTPITATTASAVIQTWHTAPNTHPHSTPTTAAAAAADDIFSLAAITLDILTHLCKRKLSAFAHHRGARNRTAGRGGGVADASFHLDRNAPQVSSWITLLDSDARKRAKDPVFAAVRELLGVVREMLVREPARRVGVGDVESRFGLAVSGALGFGGVHCVSAVGGLAMGRGCGRGRGRGRGHGHGQDRGGYHSVDDDGGGGDDGENDDDALTTADKRAQTKKNGKVPVKPVDPSNHSPSASAVSVLSVQEYDGNGNGIDNDEPPNSSRFSFGFVPREIRFEDEVDSDSATDNEVDDLDEFDDSNTFYHSDHSGSSLEVDGWRDPDLLSSGSSASKSPYEHGYGHSQGSLKDPVLYYGIAMADQ